MVCVGGLMMGSVGGGKGGAVERGWQISCEMDEEHSDSGYVSKMMETGHIGTPITTTKIYSAAEGVLLPPTTSRKPQLKKQTGFAAESSATGPSRKGKGTRVRSPVGFHSVVRIRKPMADIVTWLIPETPPWWTKISTSFGETR